MIEPSDISLQGKTALVTGAASGIGRAIAETYGRFGAQVIIIDKQGDKAEQLAAAMRERGDKARAFCADVGDRDALLSIKASLDESITAVDILVNNVGDFLAVKPFLDSDEGDWDALYAVNLRQLLTCTKVFVPAMLASGRGGSVICISSIEGQRGIPNCAVYGAFKTAIAGLVRSLALEFSAGQVRINAIAPETTETEQVQPAAFTKPEHMRLWPYWNPMGRYGQPNDIAGAALYLALPMAQWVTGTTLLVDGGALAAAGFYRVPDEDNHWTLAPVIKESGFIF